MSYLHVEVNPLGKCLMAVSETYMAINVIILNKIVKIKTFIDIFIISYQSLQQ